MCITIQWLLEVNSIKIHASVTNGKGRKETGHQAKRLAQPWCKIWLPLVSTSSCPTESLGHFGALCFQNSLVSKSWEDLAWYPSCYLRHSEFPWFISKQRRHGQNFHLPAFPSSPVTNIKTALGFTTKGQYQTSHPFNSLTPKMHSGREVTWVRAFFSMKYKSTCIFHCTSLSHYSGLEQNAVRDNK